MLNCPLPPFVGGFWIGDTPTIWQNFVGYGPIVGLLGEQKGFFYGYFPFWGEFSVCGCNSGATSFVSLVA
jgi:hypothetical protein